jgi:hypothetical protein
VVGVHRPDGQQVAGPRTGGDHGAGGAVAAEADRPQLVVAEVEQDGGERHGGPAQDGGREEPRLLLRGGDGDLPPDRGRRPPAELLEVGGVGQPGGQTAHGHARAGPEADLAQPSCGLLDELEQPLAEVAVTPHRPLQPEDDPVVGEHPDAPSVGRLGDDHPQGRRAHLDHRGPHEPDATDP